MDKKRAPLPHRQAGEKLRYEPGVKDVVIILSEAIVAAAIIAYGFFDSVFGLFMVIPVFILNCRRYLRKQNEKKEEDIRREFKEILLSVASSIQTGYSVENAFADAVDVLKNMYGEKSLLIEDLIEMNRQVMMHVSVEKAFIGIVRKYPLEEIESFGEIFLYTKRLGGGYAVYLKDTADRLEERITLQSELDSMITQKKLELTIMSVMPAAILLYMKLTGGDFLQPLYHNVLGIVLMIVCLILYGGSVALGNYMIAKVKSEL